MLLTAATARGQVVTEDNVGLLLPYDGLHSVVTILSEWDDGDLTCTLVPTGDGGMMAYISSCNDTVELTNGMFTTNKIKGLTEYFDVPIEVEHGQVPGCPNVYWFRCPPFPMSDYIETYHLMVRKNTYSSRRILSKCDAMFIIRVFPKGTNRNNALCTGDPNSPVEQLRPYRWSPEVDGCLVIRVGHDDIPYIAGPYMTEELRGRNTEPGRYANLRWLRDELSQSRKNNNKQ